MSQTGGALQGAGEDQLNRAIEELRGALKDEPATPHPAAAQQGAPNSGVILNIPVEVQIVLGSAEMAVSELLALQKGSTVSLDRRIGEPVDVVVNGRKIARGEITVLENDPSRFGIRLTEIITSAGPA
ncbi:flagellar motor switch protein FliN [Pseudaminobacter sp. 19-2017]|uniref:Flagellar motor switch protein FliN n=1 Tax=Pseudaminobacter soli (ex Zhang et al. 2022) TaxID=2831468 RepID=A0A942E3C2_9HYPH|nr:flagellar motor switch protein FliN [Pseudaminobacter soli]MBS3650320.1 flagellar motor switch protein FliN [Pseudaminobacter soli]